MNSSIYEYFQKLLTENTNEARQWWRTLVIPGLWEAEAGGFLSLRPAWSTE